MLLQKLGDDVDDEENCAGVLQVHWEVLQAADLQVHGVVISHAHGGADQVHFEGRLDGENTFELWSCNAMQNSELLCNALPLPQLSDDRIQSCLVAQLVGDVEGVPGEPWDADVDEVGDD